jgi:hypothetical protein
MERVRRYRRRKPLNGPRRIVQVPSYWRRERYIAVRSYHPKKRKH